MKLKRWNRKERSGMRGKEPCRNDYGDGTRRVVQREYASVELKAGWRKGGLSNGVVVGMAEGS